MTDERRGGAGDAADDKLQERLTRRFDAQLAQAERDYPSLSVARRTAGEGRHAPARTRWPGIASAVVAVGVLAVVGLIGVGLASRPPQVEGPAKNPPPRPGAAIPTEIDGQRVYTMTDRVQWQNLSSSFLLAAYPVFYPVPCASGSPCNNWALQDNPTQNTASGQNGTFADGQSFDLAGWAGVEVVMRVDRSGPGILTVQAVVWPDVPTQVNGERVYRAADQASFPKTGSFLLGGRVSKPDFVPPCPMPADKTQAEQQLIPYCFIVSIDGLGVAPKSNIDEPKNEIVVARVHINDSQAADCPATTATECKASVVVESIVWRSDVLVTSTASSSPVVGPSLTAAPSQVAVGTGEGTGPASPPPFSSSQPSIVAFGPDGVPTSYGGQVVYRAANLPSGSSFLFGGVLGRDGSCAAPTGMSAKPPACGYWTLDGVAVGNMVPIQDSTIGSVVVVQIQRSKVLGVCSGGPCRTTDLLVVTQILWYGPPAPLTPPPTAARSAS
jgi:hypothetical protein